MSYCLDEVSKATVKVKNKALKYFLKASSLQLLLLFIFYALVLLIFPTRFCVWFKQHQITASNKVMKTFIREMTFPEFLF